MGTEQGLTGLPAGGNQNPVPKEPPNPAQHVMDILSTPMNMVQGVTDKLNMGVAKATLGISRALPCFPAARLFVDMVFGLPHTHEHPPNLPLELFLPSIGPVILSGAWNVLINGLPAARCGDIGFGAWCGGFFPLFEVFTGSSHVFIGGARASRAWIDFTRHCSTSFFKKKYAGKHRATPKHSRPRVGKHRKPPKEIDKDKLGLALGVVSLGYSSIVGGLGIEAKQTDLANKEAELQQAEDESEAAADQAEVEAAALDASVTARQTAADLAAAALSMAMGEDPGMPPLLCLGFFLTGSFDVLIGGFPMPGWEAILGGLAKLVGRGVLRLGEAMGLNHGCGRLFEPIDVVTGANVDDFLDFTLPAPRFVWRRWYNSQQQREMGPLGWGFRHEYQRELRRDEANQSFTYTDQEGKSVDFPPFLTDFPGEQVARHGYLLKRLSESRYELTTHDQPTLEFEFREMTMSAFPAALRDDDCHFIFEYDEQVRLSRIKLDEERTIRLGYSEANLISEVRLEQSGQDDVYVARYRHGDDGRLVEFRDALDQVASYEYDGERRMTRKTDRRGYSYRYRYDEQGRCVYTSGQDGMYEGSLRYHPEKMTTVVDYSDGGRWLYEYNRLGTITKIVDPYGGTRHRVVEPDTGRVLRELDPAGNPTELLYDEYGAHTGRRDPWGYWAPPLNVEPHPADPLEHKVPETPLEWEFGCLLEKGYIGKVSPDDPLLIDFPELVGEIAQPGGFLKQLPSVPQEKHDLLGRLIERRNADGSIERWEYDAEGNEVLYVDGDGGMHRKEYTSWNLLHREIDPAGNARTFKYSPTEKITQFVDAGGTVHDFHYDKKDRLVEVWRNGNRHDIYRYDEADNLIEKRDGEGQRLLGCIPGFGRLDRVRDFADGERYYYEYNSSGRITKAQTRRCRMVLDYDEEGRSTRDERNGLGVENEYAWGGLVSTTVFEKFITEYRRRYDGSLVITDPTGGTHTIHFSDGGLILKELGNGTRELAQYDERGRCRRKVAVSVAGGAVYSKVYSYSAAGDLVRVEDNRRGKIEYHYDAAHRLKLAEREDGRNELYAHDKAGNLILQPGLNDVKFGSGNKLKEANGERFHYDQRDNVVMRQSERRPASYEYDSFDQLVGIKLNGRGWQADYDALGRRTRKSWAGWTTEYYWDHDRLAGETRNDGSVRVYVYADEKALVPFLYVDYLSLNAEPKDGSVKYLFTNQLGVPERVEDDSGRTIWLADVSAYGMVHVELGNPDEVNLRFPGHYYDAETGLHYNRFRYYDPRLGRYLQCDPLGIAGGYNLYAYVGNPLIGVDILGLTNRHHNQTGSNDPERNDEKRPVRTEVSGSPHPGPGEALVGSSRDQMRRAAAKHIASDPNHPLSFLLDPVTHKFHSQKGLTKHHILIDHPELVQMGHIRSNKLGEATEYLMLQSAWENQYLSRSVEASHIGGEALHQEAIVIGGVAVSEQTAREWEMLGYLPKGTVDSAPRIRRPK